MKPNINSIEVHPQLNNKGHLVDGALVGVGSLWLAVVPYPKHPYFREIARNYAWEALKITCHFQHRLLHTMYEKMGKA